MSRHPKFNWKLFARDVKETRKRAELGLRECARKIGVHHATFWRAEMGKPLTVPVFLILCNWMITSPFRYKT